MSYSPLQLALRRLYELVRKGVEYPDAEWKACREFKVKRAELAELYDEGIDWRQA